MTNPASQPFQLAPTAEGFEPSLAHHLLQTYEDVTNIPPDLISRFDHRLMEVLREARSSDPTILSDDALSPIDAIFEQARSTYREEVERRRTEQVQRHCSTTGELPSRLSSEMIRRLTNRATAGAGKKRNQELLARLEQFARNEYERSKRMEKFLVNLLAKNAELLRRAKQEPSSTPAPAAVNGQARVPDWHHSMGNNTLNRFAVNTTQARNPEAGAAIPFDTSFLDQTPGEYRQVDRPGNFLTGTAPMELSEVSDLGETGGFAMEKDAPNAFLYAQPSLALPNTGFPEDAVSYAPHAA